MLNTRSPICSGCGQYQHSQHICQDKHLLSPNITCHLSEPANGHWEGNPSWSFNDTSSDRKNVQSWLPPNQSPTTPLSNGHEMSRQTTGNIISNSPITPLDQIPLANQSASTNILSPDRTSKAQMPTIVTHFASRSNTMEAELRDDFTQGYGYNSMTDMSANWIQFEDMPSYVDQFAAYTPDLSTTLQHPFEPQSRSEKCVTMSANTSPVFSSTNTPSSVSKRDFSVLTPLSQNIVWTPISAGGASLAQYSPRSPYIASPYARRNQQTSSRFIQQAQSSMIPKHQISHRVWKSEPVRQKRPMAGHSYSDGSVSNAPAFQHPGLATSQPRRRRAISSVFPLSEQTSAFTQNYQQFQQPASSIPIITAPHPPNMMQNNYPYGHSASQASLAPNDCHHSILGYHQHHSSLVGQTDDIEGQMEALYGKPPPASDFVNCPESQRPIRQEPHFNGDIYTPLWKRRDAKGQYWEGWCGLCSPGVWLSMKTSRYWDDKKRNHGISAKTKKRFVDPVAFRVVDLDGQEVDPRAPPTSVRNFTGQIVGDAGLVEQVDKSLRRHEGQCGKCGKWVLMSGARTRIEGKHVGWWLHAADCYKDLTET